MSNVTTLPVKPKFYCVVHSGTNAVLSLDKTTYCTDCLTRVAKKHCEPIFNMSDFAPQAPEPA